MQLPQHLLPLRSQPVQPLAPTQKPEPVSNQGPAQISALPADQLKQTAPRSTLQQMISFFKPEPAAPVTAADTAFARELEAKSLRGRHPSVEDMGRYRHATLGQPQALVTQSAQPQKLAEIVPAMKTIFSRVDKNQNGYLSDAELKQAVRDPSIKGSEAVALATLLKLNGSIQKIAFNEFKPTSGVHQRDLNALARKANKDQPSRWTLYVESYVFNQSLKLRQTHQQLFPKGVESIRPDQIRQGDYGTCTILAAAGALAASPAGKQAILKMMSEKPDGSFEVRFPGEKPLTVKRPTDTELILYANAGPDGLWLSVLEKAFVAKVEQAQAGKSPEEVEKAVNSGVYLSEGIRLLTGKEASEGSVPNTPLPQLRAFVSEQLQAGHLLLATLDPESEQAQKKLLENKTARHEEVYSDGLVGLHAYSVLSYDATSDRVTLYNPWGNTEYGNDGVDDGKFALSMAEFHQLFSHISWQK